MSKTYKIKKHDDYTAEITETATVIVIELKTLEGLEQERIRVQKQLVNLTNGYLDMKIEYESTIAQIDILIQDAKDLGVKEKEA